MMSSREHELLRERILRFDARANEAPRVAAMYAAAIVTADDVLLTAACHLARDRQVPADNLYEIMLQSYLFLGFPRMLIAAQHLARVYPRSAENGDSSNNRTESLEDWYQGGMLLCRRVYGRVFDQLRDSVSAVSPEVFEWMILEGYGKVLSRPGLSESTRELANVAFLMMDHRPEQLFSHMRGTLNVGVPFSLLNTVVEDIGEAAGAGYETARTWLDRLRSE